MALKLEIRLTKYSWADKNNIVATGFCWHNHRFTDVENLPEIFIPVSFDFDHFASFCQMCNGQFSVLAKKEGNIWLHCGYSWSYPLFYSVVEERIIISDDPGVISFEKIANSCSEEVRDYFLMFGVTPGAKTLFRGIKTVRPGETVLINLTSGQVIKKVFELPIESEVLKNPDELAFTIRQNFSKYALLLKDKQVFLPLTGGYDSRLLACLLKESGLKNVTCITWGRPGMDDAETARLVAEKLQFEYIFIPYTNSLIGGFALSHEFKQYADYAGHITSMPYFQDYFAIKYLQQKNQISGDAVFIPGHPGDFLRGSHLYPGLGTDSLPKVTEVIRKAFGTWLPMHPTQKAQVLRTIFEEVLVDGEGSKTSFQRWDFEERQCKLIGNSSQVYSFFGIRHLAPLFDRELVSYFLELPFSIRLFALLYNKTLETHFFRLHKVDIAMKDYEKGLDITSCFKEMMIRYIPGLIKKRYYPVDDPVFYREITHELIQSIPEVNFKEPEKPHFYNGYIVQWYLNWLLYAKPTD